MTQNTSGGSIANGEKSVGSDSKLTNDNQQHISKAMSSVKNKHIECETLCTNQKSIVI